MLEFEIASIYYLVAAVVTVTPYFGAVPEGMKFPCVFYPPPDITGESFSLSAYALDFVIYVKFMDRDNRTAHQMASAVQNEIMVRRNRVPLVDDTGNPTGKCVRIDNPEIRRVEEGVYQLKISWRRHTAYHKAAAEQAKEIFLNGKPIEMGEKERDGEKERG